MADNVFSVIATVHSKVSDLAIKDGQLIFVQDKHKIALDFGGKRVFYNEIIEIDTESARTNILAPITGAYYFVIETAVLWTYRSGWVRITTPPEEIVFIGTEMPELGSVKTLYINKVNNTISVWDETNETYVVIADKTIEITNDEIDEIWGMVIYTGDEVEL